MRHDLPPTETDMEQQMSEAHRIAAPKQVLCPVCSAPLIGRKEKLVCVSDQCRERIIETCSDC